MESDRGEGHEEAMIDWDKDKQKPRGYGITHIKSWPPYDPPYGWEVSYGVFLRNFVTTKLQETSVKLQWIFFRIFQITKLPMGDFNPKYHLFFSSWNSKVPVTANFGLCKSLIVICDHWQLIFYLGDQKQIFHINLVTLHMNRKKQSRINKDRTLTLLLSMNGIQG